MKTINDFKHVKGTTAKALLFNGKFAGRIIANWSDNPAGCVCTASVIILTGPLADIKHAKTNIGFSYNNISKAGGYGYDKFSAAVYGCFRNAGAETIVLKPGNGQVDEEFLRHGYEIYTII